MAAALRVLAGFAPGLGAVLQELHMQHQKLHLGKELCANLTLRFTDFGAELTRVDPTLRQREHLLERLEALATECVATVETYGAEKNLLKRILKFDTFADAIKLYNERLDTLLGLLAVRHTAQLATLLEWRTQFEQDAASVAKQLDVMVDLQKEIRMAILDLPKKEDMVEIMLLVKRDAAAVGEGNVMATDTNAPTVPRLQSMRQFSVDQAARRADYKQAAAATPPSWLVGSDELELGRTIDDDGQSCVQEATWRGIRVAVKQYGGLGESPVFDKHLQIWRSLVFLHVAQLYGAGSRGGAPFFVYEYAARTSLDRCGHAFSTAQRYGLLRQAAVGLAYLHARKIVHGNVCCANLLVTEHGVVKVFGFGASYRRDNDKSNSRKMQTREAFKAPECLGILANGAMDGYTHSPSFASDVYSFGLTIVEALAMRRPFDGVSNDEIERLKRDDAVPSPGPLFHGVHDAARALVQRMCKRDASQRVSLAFVIDELGRLERVYG